MVETTRNPNSLSYWFPKIAAAGVPVPKTVLIEMSKPVFEGYLESFDGEQPSVDPQPFFDAIKAAGDQMGWPCFLRSDHTSNKHSWNKSCFLENPEDIPSHVWEIIEFSEMVGFVIDMSWTRWAVRELLPVYHLGYCPDFGNMPIVREFRFFVDDGAIRCWHAYWPNEALEQGGAVFKGGASIEILNDLDQEELDHITPIVERAGRAVPGSWSIDVLQCNRTQSHDDPGWIVTDMAIAADSFHWPSCEHARAYPRMGIRPLDEPPILDAGGE